MSLEVKNLALRRGGAQVFSDVTMRCEPGEALILRGPNGVGKTSLLRTLAGFLSPSAGDAVLYGASLSEQDEFQDHLVYAGHSDAIKAQLTVAENLSFWAEIYGQANPTEAIEMFDLSGLKDRLAGRCSAGQKRRLGLARLMISGRKLWLMDEPTVALDAKSRGALSNIVTSHLAGGGMAVIATHDPDLVQGTTFEMQLAQAEPSEDGYWEVPA